MCRVTGAPPHYIPSNLSMEPIDISHIHKEYPRLSEKIPWVLAMASEIESYLPGDEQVYVYLDPKSIFFQVDSKRKSPRNSNPEVRRREERGQLDPSIKADLRDLHFIPDVDGFLPKGLVLVSARYPWTSYLSDIRTPLLQKLLYDLPIALCGETIGDRLQIRADHQPRTLLIISGGETTGPVRMCGSSSDIMIMKGMGVTFQDPEALSPKCAFLQGLVVNTDDYPNAIKVRLALNHTNLPEYMNWARLGPDQVLQTRLEMMVDQRSVLAAHRIMPHALHQHGGHLKTSAPGSYDLVVVGDISFVTRLTDPRLILNMILNTDVAVAPHVKIQINRVAPLQAKCALDVIAGNNQLFGFYRPGIDPYLYHLATSLHTFALSKTRQTRNTLTDNTLHLQIPGCIFASMLKTLVPWSSTLQMQDAVSLWDGVLMIKLPDFQSAAGLLQRDNGLFDFTQYGCGFVELFAPIVFKWEMFDTSRDTDESRSVDGFVAITFAFYEERNRDNNYVIKGTRTNRLSAAQLDKRPSECPRS
jgi:hypothetical protein